jgi:hypothetical protein
MRTRSSLTSVLALGSVLAVAAGAEACRAHGDFRGEGLALEITRAEWVASGPVEASPFGMGYTLPGPGGCRAGHELRVPRVRRRLPRLPSSLLTYTRNRSERTLLRARRWIDDPPVGRCSSLWPGFSGGAATADPVSATSPNGRITLTFNLAEGNPPSHHLILPFTRMWAAPWTSRPGSWT